MAQPSAPNAAAPSPTLLRNASFHLLWASTLLSGFGDRMAMVTAMALLGYGVDGAETSSIQSGVDFFFFLPYLVWAPIAGWLIDRLPRKWVLFVADELRGLIILAVLLILPAGAYALPESHHWLVWSLILAIGLMAATFVPAKLAVLPNVAGYGSLTRANAAVVLTGIIGNLLGFRIGGAIAEASVPQAVALAAGAYMGSGLVWPFLREPFRRDRAAAATWSGRPAQHGPVHPLREIADGVRYALSHRPVLVLIVVAALIWAGTAVYLPALTVVTQQLYGGTLADFGSIAAWLGLGMAAGSLAIGIVNPRLGAELLIAAGLIGAGLFIGLQMLVPSYAVGAVLALGAGFSAAMLMVPLNAMLQRVTSDHIRGRVFAAKEVVAELGKVAVAGTIWWVPGTDPLMRPLALAISLLLLIAAVIGIARYILRGPTSYWLTNLLWRIARLVAEAWHGLRFHGRQRVPRTGPVLLVSNHTSGIDPLLIQAALPRLVHWMMAREYRSPLFAWLWHAIDPIPVDRSHADPKSLREAIRRLREGKAIGIFPEGGIDRRRRGIRRFGPGVAMIARQGRATVVPVYISGTPVTRSPLTAFLVPSRSRVVFGQPLTLDPTRHDRDAAHTLIRQALERTRREALSIFPQQTEQSETDPDEPPPHAAAADQ